MASIEYVVESYADYLRGLGPKFWQRFQTTRKNAPESALAEAIVSRVFQVRLARSIPLSPTRRALEGRTVCACGVNRWNSWLRRHRCYLNIPNRVPEDMEGGPFGLLTAQIDETATKKLPQFRYTTKPRILAIASSHFASHILLDSQSAMNALISQPFWVAGGEDMSTDLKYSLFLRADDGEIVVKSTDVSAVMLVAVGADRSYVCGALHPDPRHRFDSAALWQIPFAYLKDWPVERKKLRTMWTLGTAPKPMEIPHAAIR